MEYKIRELRKRRGLNQAQLAQEVGATLRQISYWENGRGMSIEDAARIADYFGVTIDALVGHAQPDKDAVRQELLSNYELLNSQGRRQLAIQSKMMADFGLYTKDISEI